MQTITVRGVMRGTFAAFAVCAALGGGAAGASAAPLVLEPAQPAPATQVGEDFTSSGSSTISSAVNAKGICLFQNTLSGMDLDC